MVLREDEVTGLSRKQIVESKDKDITGGLPRVAELFEARKPKEHALISEIDGLVLVQFGKDAKGKRQVMVVPEVAEPVEYLVPKGRHLTVQENDHVKAGEALMDGAANPLLAAGVHQLPRSAFVQVDSCCAQLESTTFRVGCWALR